MVTLDAKILDRRETAHPYLKKVLGLPDHYGCNLDALYDCLTDLGETEICFENAEGAGDYFPLVNLVFHDAAEENTRLTLLNDFVV